jgi:hypothetical protein
MSQNKNARIVTVPNPNAQRGGVTYTSQREPGSLNATVGTTSDGTTTLSVTRPGFGVTFNGHEARTLYSLLRKHYENSGLSTES